jgi:cytochrome o ubiquinol oxidase subunit IV
MYRKELMRRCIGATLSLLLTLVAYAVIVSPDSFFLKTSAAIGVILVLAVFQFITQLVCFIDLWSEEKTQWNLGVCVSTISVIVIIIVGSMWIMHHLDSRMMP